MTFRSLRLLVPSLLITLGLASPAYALWPVHDAAWEFQFAPYASAFSAFSAQQAASNKVMNQYALYMEGGGTGNGVIELLMAQNNQLAKLAAFNDQYFANKSQQERADKAAVLSAEDKLSRRDALAAVAGQDTPGCDAVTAALASSGARHKSGDDDNAQRLKSEDRMTNNRTGLSNLADLVSQRATFCSKNDVTNKRPGCTQVGALPNADIDSKSLSMGAIDKGHPTPTNYTFTTAQKEAAAAYITNVLPIPGEQPQGAAALTQAGRQAMVAFQRYNARMSPVVEALSSMKSMRTAMDTAPDKWSDNAAAYQQIFGQAMPPKPSEMEILSFQVYNAYQGAQKNADWSSADSVTLQREQLRMSALQARLQLLAIQRQEEQIKLLAVLVADRLDPVNASTLKAAATNH